VSHLRVKQWDMRNTAPTNDFASLLAEMIDNSRMRKAQIVAEVDRFYAPKIKLTDTDLNRYLAGKAVPKLGRFSALVDVLGLTQGEIVRLVRAAVERSEKP